LAASKEGLSSMSEQEQMETHGNVKTCDDKQFINGTDIKNQIHYCEEFHGSVSWKCMFLQFKKWQIYIPSMDILANITNKSSFPEINIL
jgi:hypothetical protein